MSPHPSWVVLKFGGTSVSTAQNWRNIAEVVRERLALNLQPVVVHSALSGITDKLESLLTAALAGQHAALLATIEAKHRDLARSLGIEPGERFAAFMAELHRITASLAETHELSDRVRARVMAMGELLATTLGAAYLQSEGIATTWVDARQVLRSELREDANSKAGFLSATCDYSPDRGLQAAWRALAQDVITQGFIAANEAGDEGRTPPGLILPRSWPRFVSRSGPTCPACSAPTRATCPVRGCCARCITTRPRRSRAMARKSYIRAV